MIFLIFFFTDIKLCNQDIRNMGSKGCPFRYRREENANNEDENIPAKDVPYSWADSGYYNLYKFFRYGNSVYTDRMNYHKSKIFKIMMYERMVVVCDYIAAGEIWNSSKVCREENFCVALYNFNALGQYVPCMFTNGERHEKRKSVIIDFIDENAQQVPISKIIELTRLEFEKMPAVEFSNIKNAEEFDFELLFRNAITNVMWYILFGEYPDDLSVIYQWQNVSWAPNILGGVTMKSGKVVDAIAKASYDMVKKSKNVTKIQAKVESMGLDFEEIIYQLVHVMFFNGSGATGAELMSSIATILRVEEENKEKLQPLIDDATKLLSSTNPDEVYPTLTNLTKFCLEVIRMHPSANFQYFRATEDFKLKSSNGYYKIKKGDYININSLTTQRDPEIWEHPNEYHLNRSIEDYQKYLVGFGIPRWDKQRAKGGDCPGVDLVLKVLKVFQVFLTRCTIVPTKVQPYTQKLGKQYADEPFKVFKFAYNK